MLLKNGYCAATLNVIVLISFGNALGFSSRVYNTITTV